MPPRHVHADCDGGEEDLPAGDFSTWLTAIRGAIEEGRGSEVPCAGCTACCTSGQFVPIGPDETDTLAHIPRAILVRAPHRPPGHMVLGYDERGHCAMLVDGKCSIYEHRPRACRTYDCRIFTATGVEVDPDQPDIGRRVKRWRFDYPSQGGDVEHEAARSAGEYLGRHPELAAVNATQRAVLAIQIQHLFRRPTPPGGSSDFLQPDAETVRAEIARHSKG